MEHLANCEAPWRAILFDNTGADVPSLRTFLEILSRKGPEYDSDDIDCYTMPCMCYHIDSEAQPEEALRLTPPDQRPHSRAPYLQEKADRLRAR